MTEHWERTVVTGHGPEDRYAVETVLHRRGEDVMQMAMRRNPGMAGCNRIEMQTVEAFVQECREAEERRRKDDIPRDSRQGEEWDW